MSDLLLILIILGILIVLGVVAFNWLQERKYQERIASDFNQDKRDVLIDGFEDTSDPLSEPRLKTTAEPNLDTSIYDRSAEMPAATEAELPQQDDAIEYNPTEYTTTENTDSVAAEPAIEEAIDSAIASETPSNDTIVDAFTFPSELHEQTDLIAVINFSKPVKQPQLTKYEAQLKDFALHPFAFGFSNDNTWLNLLEAGKTSEYTRLVYSIQLADRGGPIVSSVLNRFQHLVETIGSELDGQVEWQGDDDPLTYANNLDQFCIDVDKTIGFHVLAPKGSTFHGTKLRGLLESKNLLLSPDGKFHYHHNGDTKLIDFAVKNYQGSPFSNDMLKSSVMQGITFQLDLPTVAKSAEVFDLMVNVAEELAKSLKANIVDDNHTELKSVHLDKIRGQLNTINSKMLEKGITPGSSHALRLFS